MAIHICTPGYTITASTSSQRVKIEDTVSKYIRVVNGNFGAMIYVAAGNSSVVATSSNASVAPSEARNFERNPNTDTYVAVLSTSGTPSPCGIMAVNEDRAF